MSAIRWINSTLGSGPGSQVAAGDGIALIDVRDMVDKPGNAAEIIKRKVGEAVAELQSGMKVVVCCDYGISRSNAVAAGILAVSEQLPFDEAVREVVRATGEKAIKVEVLSAVREALADQLVAKRPGADTGQVLVLGGSGFVGRGLLKHLGTQGVLAPSRQEVDLCSGAVDLDLLVRENGVNCIVQLANPRVFYSTTAMGETLAMLRNVLDVCRQSSTRLVYLSGWVVYSGYRTSSLIANESLPMVPNGVYAETKYLCELLIDHYCAEYDLDCLVLRSSPVYGPGGDKPKFIYDFLRKAIENRDIVTHEYINGSPELDMIHIDDVASALVKAIHSDVAGSLNIGTGERQSTAEIAKMICKIVGSKSCVSQTTINDYVANIAMDSARARAALDWEPTVGFPDGLRGLVEHYIADKG